MKNIKLTLAILSILAMTISGSALASDWDYSKNHTYKKNNTVSKKVVQKKVVSQPKIQVVEKKVNNRNNAKTYVKVVTNKTNRNVYSIRSGDTLYRISLRTGVSVDRLARLNGLNNRNLHSLKIGQILRLG